MSGYLEMLEKTRDGWIEYCDCGEYVKQSDPQNFSGGKQVIITPSACAECVKAIEEAQQIMGRLGLPEEKKNVE